MFCKLACAFLQIANAYARMTRISVVNLHPTFKKIPTTLKLVFIVGSHSLPSYRIDVAKK